MSPNLCTLTRGACLGLGRLASKADCAWTGQKAQPKDQHKAWQGFKSCVVRQRYSRGLQLGRQATCHLTGIGLLRLAANGEGFARSHEASKLVDMSLCNCFLFCRLFGQLVAAVGCTNWQSHRNLACSTSKAAEARSHLEVCMLRCYTSPLKQFFEPGGQHSFEHAAARSFIGDSLTLVLAACHDNS